MTTDEPVELLVVAGGTTPTAAAGLERVISRLRGAAPGTAVVHHDLREVAHGVVHRRVRVGDSDDRSIVELAHGCVSCTLREDLLPTVLELAARPEVTRLVLHLDPVMEPEEVCWALGHVVTDGPAGPTVVTAEVTLRGVITVVDVETWLADAISDESIADRHLAAVPDDERTIAQLVVGQAEFADAIVLTGAAPDPDAALRTQAVLDRLAPLAPRMPVCAVDPGLLDRLPESTRRGRPDSVHAALLHGQPPLHDEAGVRMVMFNARRPFHPDRLHRALDVLLDGVVRARGRIWFATRPDDVLWLESAGGGLQIGYAGDWLAAGDDADWDAVDPERRTQAALHWHPRWGDRTQSLSILMHAADPDVVDSALRDALLDDGEVAAGEDAWRDYPDPFGWWHAEPCEDLEPAPGSHRADPNRGETT